MNSIISGWQVVKPSLKAPLAFFLVIFVLLSGCSQYHNLKTSDAPARRIVSADVVALDQVITYNRFGSFNPNGMIYALRRDVVDDTSLKPIGNGGKPGSVMLRNNKRPRPLILRVNQGDILEVRFTNLLSPGRKGDPKTPTEAGCGRAGEIESPSKDAPATRCASIVVSGLTPIGNNFNMVNTGISGIQPGETVTYRWDAAREGTFLFFSNSAPAGGEGDGGSLVHGLFGAVHVEPEGSSWYRSQVTEETLKKATIRKENDYPIIDYAAVYEEDNPSYNIQKGDPVLNILNTNNEIVYGDLNAIIQCKKNDLCSDEKTADSDKGASSGSFREFSVIFHDELKTIHPFDLLNDEPQLAGVRDGFGINYGASGVGTILLANRNGIGPAKDCVECFYEEFFLQSWANGDPALMVQYPGLCNPYSKYPDKCSDNAKEPFVPFPDDPSNVHHSYLGDNVKFRNLHAGPKETHVFHLHAHQWESQGDKGSYLDSQTIGPEQGFSYNIFYGGSGNRNLTPGDSIFHCHLYPHFAQGMWELWRVHDVFEDGSRFLPDGEMGPGTNLSTGKAVGGSPIPALVPMPFNAMAPLPTEEMPGFPFYIAGEVGHRVPQAPLDLENTAGLPRHVILQGTRIHHENLAQGDFSADLTSAQIRLLPLEGTPMERAAMEFHGKGAEDFGNGVRGYKSITPGGVEDIFKVNGLPQQPGAPFADPCLSSAKNIKYRVSAIQLDMIVNKHDWHDPQARINVLDGDVSEFEGKRSSKAEPFFFRAHSGDCITFYHTNRTPKDLEVDDFQVKTPTDTIGQHIHLVKFDVTASDGSANGWNYEDGSFARDAVIERIEATHNPGGWAQKRKEDGWDEDENLVHLSRPEAGEYQTSIQRWWADPQTGSDGKDKTLRTVFTHDHFAPSSIQQHGFYNALVIEPEGSKWYKANGTPLEEGKAVGTRAIIEMPNQKEDHREFMLAIADFALLYDGKAKIKNPCKATAEGNPVITFKLEDENKGRKGENCTIDLRLNPDLEYLRTYPLGNPVDPPDRPEAISTDHHNPYLVNYKHDPIPLRIGKFSDDGTFQKIEKGKKGDMTYVFSSKVHQDPFLKPFKAYEGDKVQLRIIQGAQEVQHTMTVHGLRWRRDIGYDNTPYVNAQEIGISEHFEMELPPFSNIGDNSETADYLFHFGSVDDLWNGAWGIIRSFAGPEKKNITKSCENNLSQCENIEKTLEKLGSNPTGKVAGLGSGKPGIPGIPGIPDISGIVGSTGTCPEWEIHGKKIPTRQIFVEAWRVERLLNGAPAYHNERENIYSPNALVFIGKTGGNRTKVKEALEKERELYRNGIKKKIEPMVLRANAGDCLSVTLVNRFRRDKNVPPAAIAGQKPGEAELPRITDLLANPEDPKKALKTSSIVTLHPQLLSYYVREHDGAIVGYNEEVGGAMPVGDTIVPGRDKVANYTWYAGTIKRIKYQNFSQESLRPGQAPPEYMLVGVPEEFGAVNLTSFGDVIKHGTQGLVGALIIEPEGSIICSRDQVPLNPACPPDPAKYGGDSNLVAEIYTKEMKTNFREFVVIYQDGLNLYKDGQAILDCHICDDSYDLGEKAVNYRTEPFWTRLGMPHEPHGTCKNDETGEDANCDNTNDQVYPRDFFLKSKKGISAGGKEIETTIFKAEIGQNIRFRVLQPAGRARQRSFQVYGHDYDDYGIPNFGSPHSSLVSVGKGITADIIGGAKEGCWIYRDGPSFMFSGGVWGLLKVGEGECIAPKEK